MSVVAIKNGCFSLFCRHGMTVNRYMQYEEHDFHPVDFATEQHLLRTQISRTHFLCKPIIGVGWLDGASYFVDWNESSSLEIARVQAAFNLVKAEANRVGWCFEPPKDNKIYREHSVETWFVIRAIHRRKIEMYLADTTQNVADIYFAAIASLERDLEQEAVHRLENPNARLDLFTRCNLAKAQLYRDCIKMHAIQAVLFAVFFYFAITWAPSLSTWNFNCF